MSRTRPTKPAPTGPFTLHKIWDVAERIFKYQIRHGRTPQMRTRYKLHAEAVLTAWNNPKESTP